MVVLMALIIASAGILFFIGTCGHAWCILDEIEKRNADQ